MFGPGDVVDIERVDGFADLQAGLDGISREAGPHHDDGDHHGGDARAKRNRMSSSFGWTRPGSSVCSFGGFPVCVKRTTAAPACSTKPFGASGLPLIKMRPLKKPVIWPYPNLAALPGQDLDDSCGNPRQSVEGIFPQRGLARIGF